jgi:hypothetical protein
MNRFVPVANGICTLSRCCEFRVRAAEVLLAIVLLGAPASDVRANERSTQICHQHTVTSLDVQDIPTPLSGSELENCDEQALYYGIGRPVDFKAALQCGYYQRAHPQNNGNLFYGPGVLSMLYANGRGVARDIDKAIRFSCENRWTSPREIELRIDHLEALRHLTQNDLALLGPFDLCDDVTSGLSAGACAYIPFRIESLARERKLADIQGTWNPQAVKAFARVAAAEKAFAEARIGHEVEMRGSGRAEFAVEDSAKLEEQVLMNLLDFGAGRIPAVTVEETEADDRELGAVYQQLMKIPEDDWTGTVSSEGIESTERAWLAMRDSWIEFGKVAFPNLTANQIKARLTHQRIHQLRSLLLEQLPKQH